MAEKVSSIPASSSKFSDRAAEVRVRNLPNGAVALALVFEGNRGGKRQEQVTVSAKNVRFLMAAFEDGA